MLRRYRHIATTIGAIHRAVSINPITIRAVHIRPPFHCYLCSVGELMLLLQYGVDQKSVYKSGCGAWESNVCILGGGLWNRNRLVILQHTFKMQPDSLNHVFLYFLVSFSRGDAPWKVRHVGTVVTFSRFNHNKISVHYHSSLKAMFTLVNMSCQALFQSLKRVDGFSKLSSYSRLCPVIS